MLVILLPQIDTIGFNNSHDVPLYNKEAIVVVEISPTFKVLVPQVTIERDEPKPLTITVGEAVEFALLGTKDTSIPFDNTVGPTEPVTIYAVDDPLSVPRYSTLPPLAEGSTPDTCVVRSILVAGPELAKTLVFNSDTNNIVKNILFILDIPHDSI
jgi:hypothetical protein